MTATLERERQEGAAKLAELTEGAAARAHAAREEGRLAAEATASESAAAERARNEQATLLLEERLTAADEARVALERDHEVAALRLKELAESAAAREANAREEGRKAGELAASQSASADRAAAEKEKQGLQERLHAADHAKSLLESERAAALAQLAELTASATTREQAAREEGRGIAEAATAAALQLAREAQRTAEAELEAAQARKEEELQARLNEQREALEQDKAAAVNVERSQAFAEKLKLENKLQEVQRQLQNKTAGDLGEGAEVNLFEMLKAEFPNDRITRVSKGVSGADIVHRVIHRGKECGSILYDSKNCGAWRNDYATKLRQDQLAAEADFAVLATPVFPGGARQLHVLDGVILTNPARASVIAQILRKQLVQLHILRVSAEARDEKTSKLYEFITSDRCAQLLDRMSTATEDLEELDVKEVKVHEATWKKRGQLLRSVQKHQADFSLEIDRILEASDGRRKR
jgi:hypothetical protein